jgi:hypothetical protein
MNFALIALIVVADSHRAGAQQTSAAVPAEQAYQRLIRDPNKQASYGPGLRRLDQERNPLTQNCSGITTGAFNNPRQAGAHVIELVDKFLEWKVFERQQQDLDAAIREEEQSLPEGQIREMIPSFYDPQSEGPTPDRWATLIDPSVQTLGQQGREKQLYHFTIVGRKPSQQAIQQAISQMSPGELEIVEQMKRDIARTQNQQANGGTAKPALEAQGPRSTAASNYRESPPSSVAAHDRFTGSAENRFGERPQDAHATERARASATAGRNLSVGLPTANTGGAALHAVCVVRPSGTVCYASGGNSSSNPSAANAGRATAPSSATTSKPGNGNANSNSANATGNSAASRPGNAGVGGGSPGAGAGGASNGNSNGGGKPGNNRI